MDKTHGVIIDGFTSGGTNTVSSLRLMLTKSNKKNWEPDYSLGLIDLVKSAGISTYWLSNQGYLGYYDTPVSAIADKSDYTFFLKSGDYHRIIQVKDKKYDYLSCYIASIQKTDEILSKINKVLSENYKISGRSYSMIYFADHGLAHREIDEKIVFNNSRESKRHYDIPLLKVSSDDTHRTQYKVFKSGLMLVDGIANWMGIENNYIQKGYDLFSMENDSDDFGLHQRINKNHIPDDPAIDLTGK
ncbi:putative PE--lipooligosaccharide phosphorylethanolamine transferase [Xenorhabdus kozodoii]|uniref:Putative PE--lipooligosaccharide phosphorylethanolamine transferase n=2 Tax=Xenorhabdus kozodoii TaxID=351676 RepID=A0A2D0LDG6_9GAMM|nr:sulfatase-like hydrolase/transferase [Xenorhabdus kozodoii]PHM73663.1 putative PE--lipooligosaccharide phosphorylethanolamine transferase [Xenorhabdus kozodoii]